MFLNENQISINDKRYTWNDLAENAIKNLKNLDLLSKHRLIITVKDEFQAFSIVVAGIILKLDFAVLEQSRLNDSIKSEFLKSGTLIVSYDRLNDFDADHRLEMSSTPGRISVITSGTTGVPKLIPHTLNSLNTFEKIQKKEKNRWFLPYQIGTYAWYQMVMMGLFVENQHLVASNFSNLIDSFQAEIKKGEITAISSTPTFWRQALISINSTEFKNLQLKFISLGGEIVDQSILDRLILLFPNASIRHIYASSESGAAIVVSDKLAGFDSSLLNKSDSSVFLKIKENKLFIRSKYGNIDAKDKWIDTGDIVEQKGNRVFFCGRDTNQVINVGGQKAYPSEIEAHLLTHPNVMWAKVTAKKSSFIGYLPIADVVLKNKKSSFEDEKLLTEFCENKLPEYAIPRIWNFIDDIPLRTSLKS